MHRTWDGGAARVHQGLWGQQRRLRAARERMQVEWQVCNFYEKTGYGEIRVKRGRCCARLGTGY